MGGDNSPMATSLTPSRRHELRAQAHKLNPVVLIGDKGLTDEVIAEIDRALKAHELIKVRAAGGEREQREAWMRAICERTAAEPVQQIGKVLVVWRENLEKKLDPRPLRPSGRAGDDAKSDVKRTERRRFRTASRPPESAPRRRRPRSSR